MRPELVEALQDVEGGVARTCKEMDKNNFHRGLGRGTVICGISQPTLLGFIGMMKGDKQMELSAKIWKNKGALPDLPSEDLKRYTKLVSPGGYKLCMSMKKYLPNACNIKSVIDVLGQGAYGIVLSVMNDQDQKHAVKVIVHKDNIVTVPTELEVAIQNDFHRIGLAPAVNCTLTATNKYGKKVSFISMDTVDGTLFKLLCLIRDQPDKIREAVRQLVGIMKTMRKYGITHGDMHGGNIGYRNVPGGFKLMLIDFGQSSTKVYNPVLDAEKFISILLHHEKSPHTREFAEALQQFLDETEGVNGYQLVGTKDNVRNLWVNNHKNWGRRDEQLKPLTPAERVAITVRKLKMSRAVDRSPSQALSGTMIDAVNWDSDDDSINESKTESNQPSVSEVRRAVEGLLERAKDPSDLKASRIMCVLEFFFHKYGELDMVRIGNILRRYPQISFPDSDSDLGDGPPPTPGGSMLDLGDDPPLTPGGPMSDLGDDPPPTPGGTMSSSDLESFDVNDLAADPPLSSLSRLFESVDKDISAASLIRLLASESKSAGPDKVSSLIQKVLDESAGPDQVSSLIQKVLDESKSTGPDKVSSLIQKVLDESAGRDKVSSLIQKVLDESAGRDKVSSLIQKVLDESAGPDKVSSLIQKLLSESKSTGPDVVLSKSKSSEPTDDDIRIVIWEILNETRNLDMPFGKMLKIVRQHYEMPSLDRSRVKDLVRRVVRKYRAVKRDNEVRDTIRNMVRGDDLDSVRARQLVTVIRNRLGRPELTKEYVTRMLWEVITENCPPNFEKNYATGRCRKSCTSEQIRSPKSGRCIKKKGQRASQSQSSRKACPDGYERNPATGRCRKACTEEQVRSPKSGRCIKKSGQRTSKSRSRSSRKACQDGYERNPTTGRCRKACTSGQVRSSKTGHCLKRCSAGRRRNIRTGRCVKQ